MTIVVIEDSKTQAEKLRAELAAAGHDVVVAHDGESGLALCRSLPAPPDVLICDILLPGIDGYEVCRRAKSDPVLRDVPVLVLTALTDSADVLRAVAAGADNYCTKPYDVETLLGRLTSALARKRRPDTDTTVDLGGERFALGASMSRLADILVASLHDASERYVELERSRERLALHDSQREEMVRVMAHEMRSPLQSMLLISELCHQKPNDLALLRSMPGRVSRMVQRLLRLIEDLGDVSSIDLGTLQVTPTRCNLVALVRDTAERVQSTITSHRIEISAPAELGVHADVNRIEQVVTNLLTNAAKYSPGADRVMVQVSRQDAPDPSHGSPRRACARVAVSDNGIGIAEDEVPHVFDRYFRTDTGKDRAKGLGLGLYICRALIEAHGGEIGVESRPGQGSTFWFMLPLAST
ncbi:MAG TPA: hybrid sensor histidine kinase/response regulator [Haliangium sp.]|nr:hybrid sensor histidine kinase/response regulator [Haliangium sp.]